MLIAEVMNNKVFLKNLYQLKVAMFEKPLIDAA